jgi:uncharacterized protein (TIGR02599 family)
MKLIFPAMPYFSRLRWVSLLKRLKTRKPVRRRSQREYRGLTNLLSVVGYYVQWDKDQNRPLFMGDTEKFVPERFRYRLMQVQQPAETVMVYADVNYTNLTSSGNDKWKNVKASPGVGYSNATDWVKAATE